MKQFRFEGTTKGHLAQPPCNEQGHPQLDNVARSPLFAFLVVLEVLKTTLPPTWVKQAGIYDTHWALKNFGYDEISVSQAEVLAISGSSISVM